MPDQNPYTSLYPGTGMNLPNLPNQFTNYDQYSRYNNLLQMLQSEQSIYQQNQMPWPQPRADSMSYLNTLIDEFLNTSQPNVVMQNGALPSP